MTNPGGSAQSAKLTRTADVEAKADLFSALVESAAEAIISVDTQGIVLSWNRSAEEMFGRTASDIVGSSATSLFYNAEPLDLLNRVVASQQPAQFQSIWRHRSGHPVSISVSAAPIKSKDRGVVGASAIVRLLQPPAPGEGSLYMTPEQQRLALDAGRVGLWVWEVQSSRVLWSDRIYDFHGLSRNDFGGTVEDFGKLVHPDDMERVKQTLQRSLTGSATYDAEFRTIRPDGEVRWLATHARVIRDSAGTPIRLLGATLDVTEAKNNDEKLVATEERLRLAQEASHIGAWSLDLLDPAQNYWSPEAYRIAALDPSWHPTYEDWLARVHADDRGHVNEEIQSAMGGGVGFVVQYRFFGGDGLERWHEARGTILRSPDGTARGAMGLTLDISERKRLDQQQQESERRLRLITDSLPVFIAYVDQERRYRFVNRMYERWFGVPSEQLEGQTVLEVHGPRAYSLIGAHVDRALAGEPQSFSIDLHHREGHVRFVHARYLPNVESSGRVAGYFALIEDITERTRAEQALAAREAEQRTLLQALPDIICRFDAELRFRYMSPAVQHMTGLPPGHFVGKTHLEAGLPPDLSANLRKSLRRVFETGTSDIVEFDFDSPVLGQRHLTGIGVPERDGDGRVCSVLSIVRDETEAKKASTGLRESEARFRQLANTIPAFVWTANARGEAVFFNDRWYSYTGYTEAESVDDGWLNALHPDDAERTRRAWSEARHRVEAFAVECRYRNTSGDYSWFLMRALPVRDDQGRVTQWFSTSTDIHEAKRVETELRRANSDLEQFAYSASHDLQEPLRMVAIYSQLLYKQYRGKLDARADEYLGYALQGALRMESLVQGLLSYTQAVSGASSGVPLASAQSSLEEALANLQTAIEESRADIEAHDLPAVEIEPMHLVQLLQNLIGNAIKYRSDEPPRIRVSAERLGGSWRFCVQDNGIGIDPRYREQVFGLFKRLHTADRYSGTGIGLALCQKIVQRYGGRIWVEPVSSGTGSCFCFTLPGK